MGEAARLGELVGRPDPGDHVHPTGRTDRGQLPMITDQEQLRLRVRDDVVHRDQVGGVGHRRLVDHDKIPSGQAPRVVVTERPPFGQALLHAEPVADVARGQAFPGQDLCGDLRGRQPDHPAPLTTPQRRVLPSAGDRADHERLSGAGRADQ